MQSNRRILYLRYTDLLDQELSRLFKIADEIQVIVDSHQESVPVDLLMEAQKYGQKIHWDLMPCDSNLDILTALAFKLGKDHRSQDPRRVFAIFLEEDALDHVISCINEEGRQCIRIKNDLPEEDTADLFINMATNSDSKETEESLSQLNDYELGTENLLTSINGTKSKSSVIIESDDEVVEEWARRTLDRLIKSGNRPAQISTLKSYILLNNSDKDIHDCVDEIIDHMNSFEEIEIIENNIVYNID